MIALEKPSACAKCHVEEVSKGSEHTAALGQADEYARLFTTCIYHMRLDKISTAASSCQPTCNGIL